MSVKDIWPSGLLQPSNVTHHPWVCHVVRKTQNNLVTIKPLNGTTVSPCGPKHSMCFLVCLGETVLSEVEGALINVLFLGMLQCW